MPGMTYRKATSADYPLLGALNHQLIRDEGHRNPMNVAQLTERMRRWLGTGEYTGRVFEENGQIVAYALYRAFAEEVYLRHLFVVRGRRREELAGGGALVAGGDLAARPSTDRRGTLRQYGGRRVLEGDGLPRILA